MQLLTSGDISQIARVDRFNGKIRKLAVLDSPELYYTTHLAYDPNGERVFITESNSKFRSLVEIDVKTGRKKTLMEVTRTGELVFNRADKSIWGIKHDNWIFNSCKDSRTVQPGSSDVHSSVCKALFDLDISGNGEKMVASLSGVKGEQSLVMIDLKELEKGKQHLDTIIL